MLIWGALALAAVAALRWKYRLPRRLNDQTMPDFSGPTTPLSSSLDVFKDAAAAGSAIYLLAQGRSAFAARMALIDCAEHTIDVQYYIWRKDVTGLLLLGRLRAAADRGVTVRLLLDDNGIAGFDPILCELHRHPNITVKLYNPFVLRQPKLLNYAFDFLRLNRRMHNKSITFDNVLTITGGRNIGDEYFDTGENPLFIDLDVLAAGEAANAVAADFERYWHSRSAYLFDLVVSPEHASGAGLSDSLATVEASQRCVLLKGEMERDPIARAIETQTLELTPVKATLVSDAPDKTLGSVLSGELLVGQLAGLLDKVCNRLDLVSPYFVPGRRGLAELRRLAQRGVSVRVLTNSLEANDVALVHAGYGKYRRRLLAAGVTLNEFKAHSALGHRRHGSRIGSSGSSLHAKTFAADGRVLFVGSFNFDPRSIWLNTEMGLLIESERLAEGLHEAMEHSLAELAFCVSLDARGQVWWEDLQSGEVFSSDPHTTGIKRLTIRVIGWLPIEWLL